MFATTTINEETKSVSLTYIELFLLIIYIKVKTEKAIIENILRVSCEVNINALHFNYFMLDASEQDAKINVRMIVILPVLYIFPLSYSNVIKNSFYLV